MLKRVLAGALALGLSIEAADARDQQLEKKLRLAFEAGELAGLHGVIVAREGEVLAEAYFPGSDERWGTPLNDRHHGPETLHDLRSVTKSVVGLLYGIALADGVVPDLDESLIAQFPEYPDLAGDPLRDKIGVGHALTMQMGTEWSEDLPYTDPRNSEIAMEFSDDRYRFALDRPMVQNPGETWTYNGGATALIARLIEKGTDKPLDAYAREKLFDPLGVETFEWVRGADGAPSAASGLRLTLPDLARIGRMIADDGVYEGRQIVPSDWLRAAFTPHAALKSSLRYGYFWWLSPNGSPPEWVAGFGNGGQRLSVGMKTGTVIAIYAGNYNDPDAWRLPVKVITDFIGPALYAK